MKRIATTNAPAALGPYAQAVDTGDTVYCSGQLGLDPATGALAEGVQAQTHQALKNLQAVLQEAGLTLDNVVHGNMEKRAELAHGDEKVRRQQDDEQRARKVELPRAQLRADRRAAEGSARRDRVHCGAVIAR